MRHPLQRGFSLIEVSIVTAIILLIAVIGVPAVTAYVVENKVPRVAEELQRFVLRLKVGAQGAGPMPYASVQTGVLAEAMRTSGVLTVNGSAGMGGSAVVAHGLGGAGEGGNGVVTVQPVDGGAAFSLTLSNVNRAACPALPSILQRLAETVRIETSRGGGYAKNDRGTVPLAYSAITAQNLCNAGDDNLFEFTFR
ncbi:prepilin-type N-terminal cleavage/methylation domain-containing protein [Orrella sp. JC864]|uniref:prepilin-type N-terminal cleavage/methylation domain-containing protein n=1 Tax=Orrella sp. JC864 TaxID=3120298 RepID=UPI0030084FEB